MHAVAENLWTLQYPLTMLGAHINRTVTVIRLHNGGLVIHPTAPLKPGHVAAISALDTPAYLVETTTAHDTFAREGWAAFPGIPYLAPAGFSETTGLPVQPLDPPPAEWENELAILDLAGKAENLREYAFLHRPTRTLIVADLAFHVTSEAGLGQRIFAVAALIGGKDHDTAMPRAEKLGIKDKAAFERSLAALFEWDFERVIVGHGDVVETGKAALKVALRQAGFLSK